MAASSALTERSAPRWTTRRPALWREGFAQGLFGIRRGIGDALAGIVTAPQQCDHPSAVVPLEPDVDVELPVEERILPDWIEGEEIASGAAQKEMVSRGDNVHEEVRGDFVSARVTAQRTLGHAIRRPRLPRVGADSQRYGSKPVGDRGVGRNFAI